MFTAQLGHWLPVKDGDPRATYLYLRHYSHRRYADHRRSQHGYHNRFLIVGPGEKMVLLTLHCDALFVWRKFLSADRQVGVNCATGALWARNESPILSSTLILEAEQLARIRWPAERLYTYVNPRAIRSTHPGYCFQCAGWRKCGWSKKGLLILEKLP
jgi:hypothetical protein